MYKGFCCLLLYLLALVLLFAGARWQLDCTVYIMATLFLLWDVGFIWGKDSFQGRTTGKILSHCRDAETLMSYFIGFYAAVLAVVFTDTTKTGVFLAACSQTHLQMGLIGAPLVLAAIPMLFIPVQFPKKDPTTKQEEPPPTGMKMLLLVNIYCEKLVVFIFVHVLLRISIRFF